MNYFVHESCYIDKGVLIGAGTKIWHFCHILKNSKIGTNCTIGQNVMIGTLSQQIIGNAYDIDSSGFLIVNEISGKKTTITSGDCVYIEDY